tara:strand:- start:9269 stop:10342 length:1074 start_codon:yes stop_codon:yes gene_type:complete
MTRPFNFSAGPATIPDDVLQQAQAEMLDWRGHGVSIMEIGHRTPIIQDFIEEVEAKLRTAMSIPDNYKVLFLAGGAIGQFAAVPLNLCGERDHVDYLITGVWSKRAAEEASKYAYVNRAANCEVKGFTSISDPSQWKLNPDAAYAYYCPNETIHGVEFKSVPDVGDVPLVADMTSYILSKPMDISRYGVIFASAQKNIGVAGVTIAIVRDDLLEQAMPILPSIWNYRAQAEVNSSANTPPVYGIWIIDLMLDWLAKQGGVKAIGEANTNKAKLLYDVIDTSEMYTNFVDERYRSDLNVTFSLSDEKLTEKFLQQAESQGLAFLKGHNVIGGVRASMYNAMPEAGAKALAEFMLAFKH